MPTIALYRLSSGEVIKITDRGQTFADRDTNFWGILTDPDLPDGSDVRELLADGTWGPLRVLGYAKIAESGINTARNAIQAEIDTFAPAQNDDENQMDAAGAVDLFEQHPRFRKLMIAYSDILKDEFNDLRQWITAFKVEVAAANNLGDLRARIATLPDLPDRTLVQLKTAIHNRINKDD